MVGAAYGVSYCRDIREYAYEHKAYDGHKALKSSEPYSHAQCIAPVCAGYCYAFADSGGEGVHREPYGYQQYVQLGHYGFFGLI